MENNTIMMPREVAMLAVKRWFTLSEAAMYLDMSEDKVKRMTQSHELAFSKRGGKMYFRLDDIEAWLESTRVASLQEVDAIACTYTAVTPYGAKSKK